MDEIVDVRSELRRPLVDFRAEMIKVTAELRLDHLGDDFDDAAVELWHSRVAPALAQLDDIAHESGIVRTYGAEVAKDLVVPAATGLFVGLTTHDWDTASLVTMTQLGYKAGLRGADARKANRSKQRQNPYYFLHSVGQNLG